MKLSFLLASACLAVTAKGKAVDKSPVFLEVDLIYPRNETYLDGYAIPIGLAVKNVSSLSNMGNHTLLWTIMPWTDDGNVPGGLM